jgi:hypothetical protein
MTLRKEEIAMILDHAKGIEPTRTTAAPFDPEAWLPSPHPDARAALVTALAQLFVAEVDRIQGAAR